MIKALLTMADGRDGILLGLSYENLARLCANEPIYIDTSAQPPTGLGMVDGPCITIVVGKTEDAIVGQLNTAGVATHRLEDRR